MPGSLWPAAAACADGQAAPGTWRALTVHGRCTLLAPPPGLSRADAAQVIRALSGGHFPEDPA